jgi:hypothetical protein
MLARAGQYRRYVRRHLQRFRSREKKEPTASDSLLMCSCGNHEGIFLTDTNDWRWVPMKTKEAGTLALVLLERSANQADGPPRAVTKSICFARKSLGWYKHAPGDQNGNPRQIQVCNSGPR